ncbi:hypothetical protein CsSME_00037854 [Camellia sinensis var. sinensis]
MYPIYNLQMILFFFYEADWEEVLCIKRLLRCFEVISGLKINYNKSMVIGVGVEEDLLNDFADALNCSKHALPFMFLGMPFGASPRLKSTWDPIVKKFKLRLATWKRKHLSFGGRLTLIKSMLSSLPVYYLSLFKMHVSVIKELESIQAKLLWGGSDLKRKIHMVKWSDVTRRRDAGGLGIRSLSVMNLHLLVKWWWRFGCTNRVLWKDILCSKYDYATNGWLPSFVPQTNVSRVWKDILSASVSNPSVLVLYQSNVSIHVGNGRRCRFWIDRWLREGSLKGLFPRLFSLSLEKEGTMFEFFRRKSTLGVWDFYFHRQLFAWEMDECSVLIHLLHCSPVLSESENNRLVWKTEVSGLFTVKSVYDQFNLNLGPLPSVPRAIWMNIAPSEMQFTCWLAWKGRLKPSVFLHSIGVLDPTVDPLCIFCNSCDEDVNHVILHCSFAWKIWTEILSWWGIIWVVPQSMSHLLEWWDGFKIKKLEKSI